MNFHTNPNDFKGSDSSRIQQAVDAAAARDGFIVIPRKNLGDAAESPDKWLLDEAILLHSNITVTLDGCHLQLSDRCRDNFFRSANCGIGITPVKPLQNIHIMGRNGAVLQGADRPRATGDGAKTLGQQTFGTDAGVGGERQKSDWRSIGILMAKVSHFTVSGFRMIDSHCWAISFEQCKHGTFRDLRFESKGKRIIDGREATILNQDGIDLRIGCEDILIENISGFTGDDLVALNALSSPDRKDGNSTSTMVSAEDPAYFRGIRDVIIRNVHGYCAMGCSMIRLTNSRGLLIEDILIDGVINTSPEWGQTNATLRLGQHNTYGETPIGTMRRIIVNNVLSRARFAAHIGGPLCDSLISNVIQQGGEFDPVHFQVGPECIRNVTLNNVQTVAIPQP